MIAMPARAAAPVPAASTGPAGFDPEAVARVEQELTKHIGPIAKLVVKKAVKEATNEEEFRQSLIESCGEGPASQAFRRTLDRTTLSSYHSRGSAAPSAQQDGGQKLMLPPEVITETQRSLASFVGPMARVLVDRAAMQARDHAEFYRVLAEAIPTEAERTMFLKKHMGS